MINIEKLPTDISAEQAIDLMNTILSKLENDINIELAILRDEVNEG